jgi:hypothetical protein
LHGNIAVIFQSPPLVALRSAPEGAQAGGACV